MKVVNNLGICGMGWIGASYFEEKQPIIPTVWGTKRQFDENSARNIYPFELSESFTPSLTQALVSASHLLITIPVKEEQMEDYFRFIETVNVLNPHAHQIFLSTIGVYPEHPVTYDESSPVLPDHRYNLIEREFLAFGEKNKTVLRLGGLIGGNRHPVHYLARKTEPLKGAHEWVHLVRRQEVMRIIDWVIDESYFGILNVVNPQEITKFQYYTEVARSLSLNLPHWQPENASTEKRKIISKNLPAEVSMVFEPLLTHVH